MPTDLERRFNLAMRETYDRAASEINYRPTDFLGMLSEFGGVRTAKRLMENPNPSDGFTRLYLEKRLDLSVEAQILRPEFRELFTDFELRRAEERLRSVGYLDPAAPVDVEQALNAAPRPRAIPRGLTREHILAAIAELDDGVEHEFHEPTGYYVVYDGINYAPKAVVGLAARHAFGRALTPGEFSGGNESGQANHVLRQLGFDVVEKADGAEPTGPRVVFDGLLVGEAYNRKELARLWGYRAWHAIGRGVVTPAGDNKIILFITRQKQESLHQYEDHFEGDVLHMEGETSHAADGRLMNAELRGDEVHLFYRDRHHSDFTYYGQVRLREATVHDGAPTRFEFETARSRAAAESAMRTEEATRDDAEAFLPENEGRRRVVQTTVYDRSVRNRQRAIEIHGTFCAACGFDFNAFYSADLARDFIQVHHRRSITEQADQPIDPASDLVPLCANCHCMVHRVPGKIMPVEELKALILRRRGEGSS